MQSCGRPETKPGSSRRGARRQLYELAFPNQFNIDMADRFAPLSPRISNLIAVGRETRVAFPTKGGGKRHRIERNGLGFRPWLQQQPVPYGDCKNQDDTARTGNQPFFVILVGCGLAAAGPAEAAPRWSR